MHSGFKHFKEEWAQVQQYFPSFTYAKPVDGVPFVAGTLTLQDEQGDFVDCYQIRIVATSAYPFAFPYVYEIGGRIPANIDWHVYPDGHCCLRSVPEEILRCKTGIKLNDFIETEVKPYFFNQKFRELNGYFLKERAHGIRGNVEFFEELFRSSNRTLIIKGIQFIKQRDEPNRVSMCFCGSGQKYRRCHRGAYRLLSNFSDQQLDFFMKMIVASSP